MHIFTGRATYKKHRRHSFYFDNCRSQSSRSENAHLFDNLKVNSGGFATEKAVLPEKLAKYLQQELLNKLMIRTNK